MQFIPLILTALAGFGSLVQAQNTTYPYSVDAGSVPMGMRISWCIDQRTACNQICTMAATQNNCDPMTLRYTCTCGGGRDANSSAYNNTLPFRECQEYKAQCVQRNPINATAQQECNAITCGGLDPARASASASSSSSPSPSGSTGGADPGSTASSGPSSSSTSNAAFSMVTKMDTTMGAVALAISAGLLFGSLAL